MSTEDTNEVETYTAGPQAETSDSVLNVENLKVTYDKVIGLREINMTVYEGEIVSLIGPNGAGKTTFTNTASGFLDYQGSIQFRGREVADIGQSELVKQGMIHCTEERDLFDYMSVEDNLELGGYLRNSEFVQKQSEFVYDLFPRLSERRDQHAHSMSGGEQQMLAIGRALMGDPELLILDEPTLGLAPVILQDIAEAIDTILDQGITILLAEQNVTFALDHADRIYLLENGEVVRKGDPSDLHNDEYIRESYLGGR
jgi:branched-chain amino acid transport system ATP-binding protein